MKEETNKSARAEARRKVQPEIDRRNEEKNRRKSMGGGVPNELGITQGQNAEQGNTVEPRQTRHHGDAKH